MSSITIGIIVLIVLCIIMGALGWRLFSFEKQRNVENQSRVDKLVQMLEKQQQQRVRSIKTVAIAMQQGQCEYVEGCIRIRMLLEQVQPDILQHSPFTIFEKIYEDTMHIPIKDAWELLDKKIKTKYLKQMAVIKSSHEKAITQGLQAIVDYQFTL